ncbi:hypothetical protein BD779DRAFT_1608204 [Infundibulicybe gibba]|nr:hypothetical protein BD779DRAFT_1608204 [Infundibulicybe gibba]
MKYVALLSGGKDSCYNLLHCAQHGHELIAAASLGPEPGKEELDSYMYQTVGQDAIEFVAAALDVPLYRQIILGNALELGTEYGDRNPKDTPGFHHPDVQGVSVGAILSNYQRVRVEHICQRLGLTPLSYLWQRDQKELLSEMISAGMECILIKVAGIGLTTKHLGKTLAEMEPHLVKLNDLYGSHICGEGGEYETLTLDCPPFKSRIKLISTEPVIHSDNGFATVAFLRIKEASLVPKSPLTTTEVSIPPLLDEKSIAVRDAVQLSQETIPGNEATSWSESGMETDFHGPAASSKNIDSWVSVTNVQRDANNPVKPISIEEEITECFHVLQGSLAKYSLQLSNCANINIFLSSMDLFVRVNAVYSTFFGSSPPARACVAVDLPDPIRIRLDCLAYKETSPSDRRALHVQGLSYWAPANIGLILKLLQYADDRIFISGQIGLVPCKLMLPSPESLAVETALALQHVRRVTDVLGARAHMELNEELLIVWRVGSRYPCSFPDRERITKNALVEKQVLLHTGRYSITDEDGGVQSEQCKPILETRVSPLPGNGALDWQVSRYENATASCGIVCVRGGVISAIHQLHAFDVLRMRGLSIRLFYIPSHAASGRGIPITMIPCRSISTKNHDDWDYSIYILAN